jgi:hypothetical protein
VFVYPCLPLVLSADINVLTPVHSSAMHSLQSKGVRDIATEVASQDLPLAGRVQHFLSIWQFITKDQWVLNAVKGYIIKFLQRHVQYRKTPQLTFTEKEEECMLAEMQNMLGKGYHSNGSTLTSFMTRDSSSATVFNSPARCWTLRRMLLSKHHIHSSLARLLNCGEIVPPSLLMYVRADIISIVRVCFVLCKALHCQEGC